MVKLGNRLFYLDNLKVWLTILVIFHHAAMPYSPYSEWVYKLNNPNDMMPWIWHFHSVNASFFMGLYFLISGYFVPKSFDKQGAKIFVKKKLIRLGIPVLVVGIILSILTGQLEVAHLWFIESLLVFCLIYACVRKFCKPINENFNFLPNIINFSAISIILGFGSFFIRQVSPQDNWIWFLGFIHIEPAHYLQYAIMFILGIIAYRLNWFEKMKNMTGLFALIIGILLAIGNYLRNGGAWNNFITNWFGIYESILCIFISFGLIWLFREFGNWNTKFWNWCSSQSYGAYIVHLFLLLGIEFATDSISMSPLLKFFCIGFFVTIISFVSTWLPSLLIKKKQ